MNFYAFAVGLLACTAMTTSTAIAQDRLPTIPAEQYSAEQAQAAAAFEAERKVPLSGPFKPLLHSPQVMTLARSMGDYLRFKSSIGNTLSELVILLTAREWSQDYEWFIHQPLAVKAGIRADITEAIAQGRRPASLSSDEAIVCDFVSELLKNKSVSDPSFERAKQRFGGQGVVDMTAIVGYYSLLAMQLNVAQFAVPADANKLPRLPR